MRPCGSQWVHNGNRMGPSNACNTDRCNATEHNTKPTAAECRMTRYLFRSNGQTFAAKHLEAECSSQFHSSAWLGPFELSKQENRDFNRRPAVTFEDVAGQTISWPHLAVFCLPHVLSVCVADAAEAWRLPKRSCLQLTSSPRGS